MEYVSKKVNKKVRTDCWQKGKHYARAKCLKGRCTELIRSEERQLQSSNGLKPTDYWLNFEFEKHTSVLPYRYRSPSPYH